MSILTSAFAYNAAEGTLALTHSHARTIAAAGWLMSVSQDGSNEIVLRYDSSPNLALNITSGGVAQFGGGTVSGKTAAGEYSIAAAYAVNDAAVSVDGAAALTDASVSLPTPTVVTIGYRSGSAYYNGHIKRLTYFPTRKTNAELQALST